jgi:RimJ/RimL family protein N-acetyltransferase
MNTTIRDYQGGRDQEVADLVLSIQNREAGLDLTIDDQPDLLRIVQEYRGGGFWVAVDGNEAIVGSIGLLVYGPIGVLKKFFVAKTYRGGGGPAIGLLNALLTRARMLELTDIVLDTPSVATRSHAFYERSGFRRAAAADLPPAYAYPDRDSILYRLQLGQPS